ncbi:hypothetical protein KP509_20G089000 [Ceratopteris richardii]|nr:hypothetical protein KP509_20G089000 [Ceratopteris richardii]
MFVVLLIATLLPSGNAARELSGTSNEALAEVGELSMEDQQQVIRLEKDMEAAKRHLLGYDPYYSKWYGGKQ